MSKPRSDSTLKTLPPERQEQIVDWCETTKTEEHSGGLQYAREQLAADGIKTSIRALSEFYNWWQLQRSFSQAEGFAQQVEGMLKKQFPDASQEKLASAGQLAFTAMATASRDSKQFMDLEYLRLGKDIAQTNAKFEAQKIALRKQAEARNAEKLRFEREKWIELSCEKILAAANDKKTRAIAESNVPKAEKIAALRKVHFADIDALQASGEIRLPS